MGTLLGKHSADDALVAFGEAGERTLGDLRRDAAAIAAGLPPSAPGSHIVLVFERDRYLFAAAMLGAWARGHAVALPPNTRRESVWEVADRPSSLAIVHDTDSGSPLRIEDLLRHGPVDDAAVGALPDDPLATVFTSGSTGSTQAWPKTSGQLLGEASMLAERFSLDGARVAATVPPGHIYGLLFSVLVPLSAGGAFLRETPFHAETVATAVRQHGADVLVTVPAHLSGLAMVDPGPFSLLRRVFSSTAPLRQSVASAFREAHELGITEVFGSSETGGIGTRDQAESEAWTPLTGVKVSSSSDGRLLVDSPYTDPGLPRPFQTADLAEVRPDGAFHHRGRVDGVVKVGGRRVSVAAVERAILAIGDVQDAAVIAVDDETGRGSVLLAAVVSDTTDALAVRQSLGERFDRSTLPRRIVFVDSLPRETNGKLQRKSALRLFGRAANGRPFEWDLAWDDRHGTTTTDGVSVEVEAKVPEQYGWYDGHFPGYPILAGAVQLHEVVLPIVRKCRPELGDLRRVSRLKFLDRIKPGDAIRLTVEWSLDAPDVQFRIAQGQTTCAAGRLTFESP